MSYTQCSSHSSPSLSCTCYSDFGYYRSENSSECVRQADLKGLDLEFCLNGTTEQLQTSGYESLSSLIYPSLSLCPHIHPSLSVPLLLLLDRKSVV